MVRSGRHCCRPEVERRVWWGGVASLAGIAIEAPIPIPQCFVAPLLGVTALPLPLTSNHTPAQVAPLTISTCVLYYSEGRTPTGSSLCYLTRPRKERTHRMKHTSLSPKQIAARVALESAFKANAITASCDGASTSSATPSYSTGPHNGRPTPSERSYDRDSIIDKARLDRMRQNRTAVTRTRARARGWLDVVGIVVTLKRSDGSGGAVTSLAGIAIERRFLTAYF